MYFSSSPNLANSGQVQLPGPKKTVVGESIEVVEKWRPLAIWSTDIEEEVTMMIMLVYNITRWHISTIYINSWQCLIQPLIQHSHPNPAHFPCYALCSTKNSSDILECKARTPQTWPFAKLSNVAFELTHYKRLGIYETSTWMVFDAILL